MKYIIYQPRCYYYVGGAEVITFSYITQLLANGKNVILVVARHKSVCPSELFTDFISKNKIEVLYIEVPDCLAFVYRIKPGNDWWRWDQESYFIGKIVLPKLFNIKEKFPNSIYISHNIIDTLALPEGEKIFLHLHGFPKELNYACKLILSNKSYKLISGSDKIKEEFNKLTRDDLSITVLKNSVDSNKFYKIENYSKQIDILFIGRLIYNKGIIEFLNALLLLKKDNFLPIIKIAGDGPLKNKIINFININMLTNVDYVGFVDESKKNELYNSAYLCCFPSLGKEGTMLTMLEASATGTPVLTTQNSSMSEFIEDEVSGFLVDPTNLNQFALKIKTILVMDKKKLEKIGNRAMTDVKNKWTFESTSNELIQIYESI